MGDGARGYSWPPFERGNVVSVKHGANSDRLVTPKADELREALAETCPWVTEVDAAAVGRYCRAEARAVMLHDYCMTKAEGEGVDAVPRSLWQEASRAESNAAKFAQDLGLDPAGRARVLRDLANVRYLNPDNGLSGIAGSARRFRRLQGHGA